MNKEFKEFEYWVYSMFFKIGALLGIIVAVMWIEINILLSGMLAGFSIAVFLFSFIVEKMRK